MVPQTFNLLLGTPIYSDVTLGQTPTFSTGSWSASLPLTNLQDRRLAKVARSTDATTASTKFETDLKVIRPIRVVAIPKHNLSLAGRVRVRAFTGAASTGTTLYDSGWLPGVTKPINRCPNSEDLAAWTAIGTPAPTLWQFSGDVALYQLTDNDAASAEGVRQTGIEIIGSTAHGMRFRVGAQGTSTSTRIDLTDTTVSAARLQVLITWSAGLPVATVAVGTLLAGPIAAPNGAWDFEVATAACVGLNAHRVDIYPATDGSYAVAPQGTFTIGGIHVDDATVPREYVKTQGAVAGVDTTGMNAGFLVCPTNAAGSAVMARYWVIEIDDTANSAGYVDLARLVLAGGWQPSVNMAYGLTFGLESETERAVTDGGAALYNPRPRRRRLVATLPNLGEEDSLQQLYEIQRREGSSGQLMAIYDPSDVYHVHRRSFLAVLRELAPLERAMYGRDTVPLSLVEEL